MGGDILSGNNFRQELLEQAVRLAFNRGGDAAALAFRGAESETDAAEIKNMDLAAVSSIHTMANGSVELKFIDRIKLIELLLSAENEQKRAASDGFIEALDRAAQRLGGDGAAAAGDVETEGAGADGDEAG